MPSIAKKISKFTQREIDYLFQHARRVIKTKECTVLLAPRQGTFGRVLIVASRKVGNAPQRNLVRRRIKSIFYEEKLYDRNFDCVVIAYDKIVSLSFDQLKSLILGAYSKVSQGHENAIA